MVYLNDDKYNISGVFFLDATWDSKRNNKYLDNYSFFLKPYSFFKYYNKNEIQINLKVTEILPIKRSDLLNILKKNIEKDCIVTIWYINELLSYKESKPTFKLPLTNNIDEKDLLKAEELIAKKYYGKISHEAFKNALYKVRKIEYMNKIIDYVPTEEYIDSVCSKYFKTTAEERLIEAIFGQKPEVPTLEKDLKETKSDTIDKDLLRARLLRVLKEKFQDFPENNYIRKM